MNVTKSHGFEVKPSPDQLTLEGSVLYVPLLKQARGTGENPVPIVLPCTLMGVRLYRSLSDVNFRRVTFILLGVSGVGLLIKAADTFPAVAGVMHSAGL